MAKNTGEGKDRFLSSNAQRWLAKADINTIFSVLTQFKQLLKDPDMAVPVAAIKALTEVIKRSSSSTMMELEVQLRAAADELKKIDQKDLGTLSLFSLSLSWSVSLSLGVSLALLLPLFLASLSPNL